tara:strand:+ start:215 stop:664 length:450 start_codon:yes stop_codon:yes gene_type:complete
MIRKFVSNYYLKIFCFPLILSSFLVDATLHHNKAFANKKLIPADDKDLYLYKGMGASYLCIAEKAGVEFPKALGVATATYVQVLEGKHGGQIEELGDTRLDRKQLFAGAEFQIVSTAMDYCPDSIPKDISKKVKNLLKENKKIKKNIKK